MYYWFNKWKRRIIFALAIMGPGIITAVADNDAAGVSTYTMAAANYGNEDAELMLLRANFIAPQHLMVLVALYRYYFYQHRLEDALLVAESALAVVGRRLEFPDTWRNLHEANVGEGVMRSMGLVRFYLMILKAAGYIHLRLGEFSIGKAMLEKLVELDSHDRIGGKA